MLAAIKMSTDVHRCFNIYTWNNVYVRSTSYSYCAAKSTINDDVCHWGSWVLQQCRYAEQNCWIALNRRRLAY